MNSINYENRHFSKKYDASHDHVNGFLFFKINVTLLASVSVDAAICE